MKLNFGYCLDGPGRLCEQQVSAGNRAGRCGFDYAPLIKDVLMRAGAEC